MKQILVLLLVFGVGCSTPANQFSSDEVATWEERAASIEIIRDNWGIPHIYGETDADAVFGMLYAQAEDDFNRIEVNFLNAMGRLAEAEGEDGIYRDLRMRLFIDEAELREMYNDAEVWLKDLMDAWADGLNYYLATHPETQPRVLTRFEPWMALSFSEGSIGGDIERISINGLKGFYGADPMGTLAVEVRPESGSITMARDWELDPNIEPTGSNGFAIAPENTANGHALLLINPHTSFYFRAENHVVSKEGLNAYGASTWGQFFVYQGFNEKAGWMHTSSKADNIDEYLETIVQKDSGLFYMYDGEERPLETKTVTINYKQGTSLSSKDFTIYRSHHGPIIRAQDGKWIAFRIMEEPLKALQQSYLRTKAEDYQAYRESMEFHTNSSNNTVYADADGAIAYFHSNFVPVRNESIDFSRPVDGSSSDTEWNGLHTIDESVHILNPSNGWIQNTNNWPFSATGSNSPRKEDFPEYMSQNAENARGLHALKVLEGVNDFTIESLQEAAYDSYLTAFDVLIPQLLAAYANLDWDHPLRKDISEQVELLRTWDRRFGVDSVPTSLAIFWASDYSSKSRAAAREAGIPVSTFNSSDLADPIRLASVVAAREKLIADFGQWDTPWGDINRFQRLTGDIVQPFDDIQPSIPVGFTSATWGSLAAYGQRTFNDTKRIYGTRGNSFVAIAEFGDSLRAVAVTAGGQSGDPSNPHFNDQAPLYAAGQLRPVHFYREDVEAHAESSYSPGQN
ncbi:MAG: acylase [Rhodothermales bacterium]|nr:acylase [Rhodothermales bacterium]MDG2017512.1 acylase [Rhodothermales bacterium]